MSHLFWLSTLVPGFALLQVLFPRDLRRGLLGALTWSFVLTVVLLVPIVVLAFLLQLSAALVSAIYVVLVVVGSIVIARRTRRPQLERLFGSTHWPEIGILLLAVAVVLPFGGSALDDSFVHAAKIRYMRDVGFSLQDPYSPLSIIETRYHVSVHHSLYAIAAWLTGEEPLELWYRSAWFFRLISLGGIGFFATTLFGSRWAGTLAMLGAFGTIGFLPHIAYPFGMTPYVPFAVLFAHLFEMLERPSRRAYLKVLLAGLALAVLHIGFWLIAAMCLMPTLFLWAVLHADRAGWLRRAGLIAGAAVPGVPFLLVTALQPNYVDAQQGLEHLWMLRTVSLGGLSITVLDPTHYVWMLPTLAATACLIIVHPPVRQRQLIVAGALVTSMIYMFTPGIFDLLSGIIPYWLIRRARYVPELVAYANLAGGLAWLARRALPARQGRIAFAATVFCAGLVVFRVSIRDYFVDRQDQARGFQYARQLQDVLSAVPPRALVAADAEWSLIIPSVRLVAVMAPKLFNSNPADGGVLQRQKEAVELLDEETTADRRREIVVSNGIDFILVREPIDEHTRRDIETLADLTVAKHEFRLFEVRAAHN